MIIVKDYFTIPNMITMARILMVPFFGVYVFWGDIVKASILFVIMAISDFFDGFIARKFNKISKLGKFLDPLADKLVILTTIFVAGFLSVGYSVPFYFAAVILLKEVYLLVGILVIYLFRRQFKIETLFIGKVTMFFEYMTVVLFLLNYFWSPIGAILHYFYLITTGLAVMSIFVYTLRN